MATRCVVGRDQSLKVELYTPEFFWAKDVVSRSDIEYFDSWNAGGNVPDFRRLQCFAEVARMRSITRAATVLHIEQPASSRQIKLLEQEIGVRLFYRNGRGVELTEQGANVLTRVSRLLQEVESAEQDIKAMKAAVATENPIRGCTKGRTMG